MAVYHLFSVFWNAVRCDGELVAAGETRAGRELAAAHSQRSSPHSGECRCATHAVTVIRRLPYRDAALAALQEETRAKARYWAALEGDVRDTKRVRLNDFSRGLGIVTTKDNANFWAFTRA